MLQKDTYTVLNNYLSSMWKQEGMALSLMASNNSNR